MRLSDGLKAGAEDQGSCDRKRKQHTIGLGALLAESLLALGWKKKIHIYPLCRYALAIMRSVQCTRNGGEMGARRKPYIHAARARANRRVYDAAYVQGGIIWDVHAYLTTCRPRMVDDPARRGQ